MKRIFLLGAAGMLSLAALAGNGDKKQCKKGGKCCEKKEDTTKKSCCKKDKEATAKL